jgi:hypothetical protein
MIIIKYYVLYSAQIVQLYKYSGLPSEIFPCSFVKVRYAYIAYHKEESFKYPCSH